jgi:hypothetical protein
MNDNKLKKFSVAIFVVEPLGREVLNTVFVDAPDSAAAFASAWKILKIPNFSKIAWQAAEIPQDGLK